jgi:DNA-binding NarL/FixJ family response regulator
MDKKATLLIADDHQLFLDGLKLLLRNHPAVEITATALNGDEVLAKLNQSPVDLALLDLNMPGLSGVELIKAVKQTFPETKILVITMQNSSEIISEILMAEAEGYILKNSGKKEMFEAISNILNGKTYYEREVLNLAINKVKADKRSEALLIKLSDRELEVLKLIIKEFTSKEIADKLFISKQTVDTHRNHIMQKTKAKNLVGLIKYAIRAGLEV